MSMVVQATCPGCKKTLRIPADWIQQSIRCKYCGITMQAKTAKAPASAAAAPTMPVATAATPHDPPPLPPGHLKAGPPRPASVKSRPAPTEPNPFAELAEEQDVPKRAARSRRRSGGFSWKGPAIVLGILLLAGTAVAFGWSRLAAFFPKPPGETTDETNQQPPEVKPGGTTKSPGKATETAKELGALPRRALLISLHNYLYANPIQFGPTDGGPGPIRNIAGLKSVLNFVLHIPQNQIALLSDMATGKDARPPLKPIIEQTLSGFLATSRPQDRIMVFFVGHSVEIEDQLYLVPIEGELKNPDKSKLIPLTWVFERMKECKARQKVLVLDINRFNPTGGVERPVSGPLSAKGEEILKNPPAGVQVWCSCSKEQESYETDRAPMGAFLERLAHVLNTPKDKGGYQGTIPRSADPLPIDKLNEMVDTALRKDLSPLKQTPFVSGKEAADGAAPDPKEAPPPTPTLANPATVGLVGGERNAQLVKSVLTEIGAPPVKTSMSNLNVHYDLLPPFEQRKMEEYVAAVSKDNEFQKAIHDARVTLWAVASTNPPADLRAEVDKKKRDAKINLSVFTDGYRYDSNEANLKKRIERDQRFVADILAALEDSISELKKVETQRSEQPKRWQVNFDFMQARVDAQFAYVMEYQSKLGEMRKEFPPRDPNTQIGWKLAAQEKLTGDTQGRKKADKSMKTYAKIAKENAGTPWEVLAKREMLTTLGLQWRASSNP